jgi:hypothetical protein
MAGTAMRPGATGPAGVCSTMAMTPEQCRAGRALARVGLDVLAAEVGVHGDVIEAFESGFSIPDGELVETLQRALEGLGVSFLPEEDGQGIGVRLRFDRAGTRQIGRWEGEGGSAADDDVP